jgi:hypothetical protein
MSVVHGRYIDGKVVLDTPADWPEGAEVRVYLAGTTPDGWPDDEDDSPEAIARRLALMERIQPGMTPDEEAAWKEQRAKDKAAQLAMWDKWTKDIGNLFR